MKSRNFLSQNMLRVEAGTQWDGREGKGRVFYENTAPYIAHTDSWMGKSALNFSMRNVARLFICQNYTLRSLVHISLTAVFKIKPPNCLLYISIAHFLHFVRVLIGVLCFLFHSLRTPTYTDIATVEQMKFYTKTWQRIK